jgi:hypothetical protein
VDSDLRTLLQEKAEEARIAPRIPTAVLRRSRRRRVSTTLLAGTLTAAVVAGFVVAARLALTGTVGPNRPPLRAGGSEAPADAYPFIYPSTGKELETTQDEVAQGSMPMWTDPRGTAHLYAVNVLGWNPDAVAVDVRGDEPITAVITNPTLTAAVGAEDDFRTTLHLAQAPGGHPPIYAVQAAQSEVIQLEPVGLDGQGFTGTSVAFRGRLSSVPQGATVTLSVDRQAGAPVIPTPGGRFRVQTDVPSGVGPLSLITVSLVDGSGAVLTHTSARPASSPVAGEEIGGVGPIQVAPPEEIPEAVVDTRQAILDAAQALDWGALRELIPDRGFTFSFGGERDPIRYWRMLESEGHVPVLGDILPAVLGTEPDRSRGVYIWPAQAAGDPSEWDEQDLEALRQIHTDEDIRSFQELGLYVGWRVGIDRDGTWVFFVAGD